jgi:hypothetical protein
MAVTTVAGIHHDTGHLYLARLDQADGTVRLPEHLRVVAPKRGTVIYHFPTLAPVMFDIADPMAVFTWLTSATSIHDVNGPRLDPPNKRNPAARY